MECILFGLIAGIYFCISLGLGLWTARRKESRIENYFLADRRLPWYAISLSMAGTHFGIESLIGLLSVSFAFGLTPIRFEWGNLVNYSLLLWIGLPFFYRKKLYTIPEFLELRFSSSTRFVFSSLFMLYMMVAILIPSLYVGGRILYEIGFQQTLVVMSPEFIFCILLLSIITAVYCIYGGLYSVVWTGVFQVAILLLGGCLLIVCGSANLGDTPQGIDSMDSHINPFLLVPQGIDSWVGMAIFWLTLAFLNSGANPCLVQRCFGAKSEWDAKMGIIGGGFLKWVLFLLFSWILLFPGLISIVKLNPGMEKETDSILVLHNAFSSVGQGIVLIMILAVIMSIVSSVLLSLCTIWTMDIHKRYMQADASEEKLVAIGQWSTFMIVVIGSVLSPFLLWWSDGIFLFIQDVAVVFIPPLSVLFGAAFFWKRAHSRAATLTLISGLIIGVVLFALRNPSASSPWILHQISPLACRTAFNGFFCLLVMTISTYLIPANPLITYDSDAIWHRRWGSLPWEERFLNRRGRNVMFWWMVWVLSALLLGFIMD